MKKIELLLNDYKLTTAEILYHMPDHPSLLQAYIWQELDLCPDFPELVKFLNFWEQQLEGKLHSVQVTNCELLSPGEITIADGEVILH